MFLKERGPGGLAGRVLSAAYLGDHVEYEIETAIGRLFVVDPAVENVRLVDSEVGIGLHSRGIALVPV